MKSVGCFDSMPTAPISSSLGWVVTVVAPDDTAPAAPVALPLLSSAGVRKPENSATFTARARTDGCVTTTVLPATSAVRMAAENTTVRTPSVPEPRATSTSFV